MIPNTIYFDYDDKKIKLFEIIDNSIPKDDEKMFISDLNSIGKALFSNIKPKFKLKFNSYNISQDQNIQISLLPNSYLYIYLSHLKSLLDFYNIKYKYYQNPYIVYSYDPSFNSKLNFIKNNKIYISTVNGTQIY